MEELPIRRWPLVCCLALLVTGGVAAADFATDGSIFDPRLDSILDELGAVPLLIMGILLLLEKNENTGEESNEFGWGLIFVGLIRLVDSTTDHTQASCWLKRMELLSVGVTFTLLRDHSGLPVRHKRRRTFSVVAFTAIGGVCAAAVIAPDRLPTMIESDQFSALSRALGTLGAVLALAGAAVSVKQERKSQAEGRAPLLDKGVFVYLCLGYGLVAIGAPWTRPWRWHWWALQAASLVPFVLAVLYLFVAIKRVRHKARETQLRTAKSNADLENFAYVASHDLQEPLRMVTSYLNILSSRYRGKLDSDADEFIGQAVDGAARMKTLIADLLAFSRLDRCADTFGPVSCKDIVARVLNSLRLGIEESGARITHDDLPEVRGAASQIEQLFQNLVSNSIKFRGEAPPRIHIASRPVARDGKWLFLVMDNGIGFEEQHANDIFQLFRRVHDRSRYPGSGIGLATCKRIVERHGGTIWAKSEPGKGTTFYFTLPVMAHVTPQAHVLRP